MWSMRPMLVSGASTAVLERVALADMARVLDMKGLFENISEHSTNYHIPH